MTFIPHVEGTPSNRQQAAAARALLATVPPGTEVVAYEDPAGSAGTWTKAKQLARHTPDLAVKFRTRTVTRPDGVKVQQAVIWQGDTPAVTPVVKARPKSATRTPKVSTASRVRDHIAAVRQTPGKKRPLFTAPVPVSLDEKATLRRRLLTRQTIVAAEARKLGLKVNTSVVFSGKTARLDIWVPA